jgi:hypothetical protein
VKPDDHINRPAIVRKAEARAVAERRAEETLEGPSREFGQLLDGQIDGVQYMEKVDRRIDEQLVEETGAPVVLDERRATAGGGPARAASDDEVGGADQPGAGRKRRPGTR